MLKIFVKAKPRAKNEKITQIDETHFIIAVKEPPINGKANNAIINALANHFNIAPSRIRLASSFSSKNKTFEIL